jgi:alkaline phosphatase D
MPRLFSRLTVLGSILLLVPLSACRPEHRPGLPAGSPFTQAEGPKIPALAEGVAVGDVTDHSAIVWFRTSGPALAQVAWVPEDGSALPAYGAVLATVFGRDFTAKVRLDGLAHGTKYRYWIRIARTDERETFDRVAREAGGGRFATATGPNSSTPVAFVWGADLGGQKRCRDEQTGYAIFERLGQVNPDFFLLLGDSIYADDRCPSPPNAPGSDFIASTLDDYRAKHRYQRGDAVLQRFLNQVPVYAMWDDHEVRNNFSGPHEPQMADGRQAFLEYWPIATPFEDPHRLYRRFRWGKDLELFMLDTRQYRDRNAEPDGPTKTMLGAAQREWLLRSLSESTATWKLIATSVPLSNPKKGTALVPGNDSWARAEDGTGFETELRGILDVLLKQSVRNVVWLATDVHYAQVNEYDPDGDSVTDFREFICGPLSAAPVKPLPPGPTFRPTTLYSEGGFMNFGVVTVNGATLRMAIIDERGTTRFSRTFEARTP